ncbi:DinB family protein [Neobacillus cucumis]|uniref:DinB family protein n=1 Tax=Neobacillus cucumis TaxID=1740721 RepID=UPI0019640E7B|nr:DinB family protein [Neobacillus cucumis]MBM7650847.1 putative damage-inducible protein DinB [Neobacillus cucumis]
MILRPEANEFPEYYVPYVKLVPEGDLLEILKDNFEKTTALFEGLSEEKGLYRYATGKWSIKEVLGHMADTERIMSYRLLRVGRGDKTPLAGFNENDYIAESNFDGLPIKKLLEDFTAVRNATITLINNLPENAWEKIGFANNTEITTRAIAYIIAGHALHHLKIINERYLVTGTIK